MRHDPMCLTVVLDVDAACVCAFVRAVRVDERHRSADLLAGVHGMHPDVLAELVRLVRTGKLAV